VAWLLAGVCGADETRLPTSTVNLLADAKVSGNLESFEKGLRGKADHVVFDVQRGSFVQASEHHEYGVGFQQKLGIIPEARAAYWMAEWPKAVEANVVSLSGVYPNQPQPNTAWKIEVRTDGKWTEHARGVGGWYDRGRYRWGGADSRPLRFDAFRVSVFSKDEATPLESIHFRGEAGISWVVGKAAPIDAAIVVPDATQRAGRPEAFAAKTLAGNITSWKWAFGDGGAAEGPSVSHVYADAGEYEVVLTFSDGQHTASIRQKVAIGSPVGIAIVPLAGPVIAGEPVEWAVAATAGQPTEYRWDFGDGSAAQGATVRHRYEKPGIYKVTVTGSDGRHSGASRAIVRAHAPETLHVPQVLLDTDQKNEQDDQHYFGYALFSELDVLGVNSVHHGGGQEPVNYQEILHVLELARQSGLAAHREPTIYRGANRRLAVPASGKWDDTLPVVSDASEAILAAARGASPKNPLWVVPVGPGTNVASAILQAKAQGLRLDDRMRVMWLGGSNNAVTGEFNGDNDPWSIYVIAHSGVETWFVPAPVGARVAIDKSTEGHLYADHPLGRYLESIVPNRNKALFDASCLSAIIDRRLDLGWIKEVERVSVAGPDNRYAWTKSDRPDAVRVIRQIDQKAMQIDLFNSMKGQPTRLIGVAPK
jgi:chitodextrinase